MSSLKRQQIGMGIVEIIIIVAVIALIGGGVWYALSGSKNNTEQTETTPTASAEPEKEEKFIWQQSEGGWMTSETAPDCPEQPILITPTDITKVTSVLYPGQTRGGNYKPHGGFRLDNTTNTAVTVSAPMDGYVMRGSQYIEQGEVQYMFDIFNNCGIMYRFDHLNTLSSTFQKLTESWPPAQANDSRTNNIDNPPLIKAGDEIATAVGFVKTKNTTFDWGVYDYRAQNSASQSTAYQTAHQQDKELSWHAVCWLDWIAEADETTLRALPAGDSKSGKKSDYCL
jgi:hypothetical protein